MGKLTDKVAVVTGGGRGIGKAIAHRFAAEGAKVAVVSRSESSCQSAADEINQAFPDSAKAFAIDVADTEATIAAGKLILEAFGKVDILVNNAGVTRDQLALRMTEEDWDVVLDTNLKGAFNCVKAFQRSLLKAGGARIINISSVVGLMGNPGQANYAASKAGLLGLTKALAKEFAARKVTVNAVAPGFIATDMTAELNDAQKETIIKNVPLGVLGSPDDIASATLFLASSEASYITGQVLTVDGGMVM
tara:strand:- start:13735 stop:14481 length:747 start_codon:yes stop_codon:yes gene_type:complete